MPLLNRDSTQILFCGNLDRFRLVFIPAAARPLHSKGRSNLRSVSESSQDMVVAQNVLLAVLVRD